MGEDRAGSKQHCGYAEWHHQVHVDHEEGTHQCAGEHRRDRDQAPARVPSFATGKARVGGNSGQRQGEDSGGQIGNGKTPCRRVLDTHRQAQWNDQRIAGALGYRLADDRPNHHREHDWDEGDRRGGSQLPPPVAVPATRDPPSGHGANEKGPECGDRGRGGEAGSARQGEAEEDDVAGHVGDEDVAQGDVADRVDDAGDDGQQDEQQRQRAVTGSAPRPAGLRQFDEAGQEAPGSDSSTVSSAVGTASSRSSGIGWPLRTESP